MQKCWNEKFFVLKRFGGKRVLLVSYVTLCDVMLWYVMVWYGMLCYGCCVMACYGMLWMLCYGMLWYVMPTLALTLTLASTLCANTEPLKLRSYVGSKSSIAK